MRRTLRFLWIVAWTIVSFALAVLAGALPRRYWSTIDGWIPVTRWASVSGIATIAAGAVIGIPAYFRYQEASSSLAVRSLLKAAGWPVKDVAAPVISEAAAQVTWLSGYLGPFTFVLLTPAGLLMTYLAATGLARTAAWYVEAAHGDPILTLVDSFVSKRRRTAAARRAKESREALEGPEVPDRLITGRAAGIPEAELVVVSSRQKAGWERGVFVITPETWYRVGVPIERQLHAGLRTLYPLTEIRDLEVRRKSVEYELPPLGGAGSHTERNES